MSIDELDPTESAGSGASCTQPGVPRHDWYPFMLVTTLFAWWGFANDITNPLVRAFKEILLIGNAQSSLVHWAFYGGHATMAIPSALVIRKVPYKSGIIISLLLYAVGALLTIPASMMMDFNIFLVGSSCCRSVSLSSQFWNRCLHVVRARATTPNHLVFAFDVTELRKIS